MLQQVGFDERQLLEHYRGKLAAAGISDSEHARYMQQLEQGLSGYTYPG